MVTDSKVGVCPANNWKTINYVASTSVTIQVERYPLIIFESQDLMYIMVSWDATLLPINVKSHWFQSWNMRQWYIWNIRLSISPRSWQFTENTTANHKPYSPWEITHAIDKSHTDMKLINIKHQWSVINVYNCKIENDDCCYKFKGYICIKNKQTNKQANIALIDLWS